VGGGVVADGGGLAVENDHHGYALFEWGRVGFDGSEDRGSTEETAVSAAAVGSQLQVETACCLVPTGTRFPAPDSASLWAWMDDAACHGVGTAEFYGSPAATARGRARCRACPVAEVCFWWAVTAESDLGYRFGIWGGTQPAVRGRIAWVTGIDYARARFVAAAMRWSATSHGRRAGLSTTRVAA
jgi:hypothetical protein